MALLLRGGDYVPDEMGGLRTVEGAEEVLQRVLFQLQARRGSFPFLPELGSRLYLLPREKPGAGGPRPGQSAGGPPGKETGGEAPGVTPAPAGAGALEVQVSLSWKGEPLAVSLTV